MNSFSTTGQGILVGLMLTVSTSVGSFAQSMASAKPTEVIVAPAALQAVVYQVPETTKFKVHFQNHSGKKVTVTLRDASNQVIYSEVVASTNYVRKFDLEELNDGSYHFEISNGNQNIIKEVALQTVNARNVKVQ